MNQELLFHQLDEQISRFIKTQDNIEELLQTAHKIGGKVYQHVEALHRDCLRHAPREKVMADAIRIKNEAREL